MRSIALALRAELLVEDDAQRLQLLQPLVERLVGLVVVIGQGREVGAPEVARVGEPRAHDAAVAGRDRRAAVAGDEVGDEDEFVGRVRRDRALLRVMAGLDPAIHAVTDGVSALDARAAQPGWPGQARP